MKTNYNNYSRRDFLSAAAVLTGALVLPSSRLFAQEDSPVTKIIGEARKSPVSSQPLRGNLTLLEGSGGNIVLMAGKTGNLMVDAGIDVSKDKIKSKIDEINKAPLQILINTHWHFDHASGNDWIHADGAKIIAHENTKKWLSKSTRVDDWNFTFPPAPAGAIPTETFAKEHKVYFDGQELQLHHYAPAHTDSDISVYFAEQDVLHVADTWWNGYYPFIDYNTGGGIKGSIAAAELNVKRTTDKTLIVPGHGPIGDRNAMIEFRDMLIGIHTEVAKLKKSGMSLKETIAAKPTKKYDEKWGNFVIGPDFFTSLVYKGA